MDSNQPSPPSGQSLSTEARLSYKFQRLREKLRAAIVSGELSGKLPGERQLARRFRVNAKTLSKALTDLAAEGLLERSIGRGTFVKGSLNAEAPVVLPADRWLIVCASDRPSAVVARLCEISSAAHVVTDTGALRPSFLNSFKAVIDFGPNTPLPFLRDLIVRNVSVVLVGREPTSYSLNAVLVDRTLGGAYLARDLMLAGHRRFVAVERQGCTEICDTIRSAAVRYAPDATVDVAFPSEAAEAVEDGATAVVCDNADSAGEVRADFDKLGIAIPARVSLCAVGTVGIGHAPCSGYFVSPEQKADAIVQVLRDGAARRPSTIWLAGHYTDAGTTGPTEAMIDPSVRMRYKSATA